MEIDIQGVKNLKTSTFVGRVVPDTDLAGYPANNFAGYRIFGLPDTFFQQFHRISVRLSGK